MRIERGLLLFLTITAHCSAFFVPSDPLLARARNTLSGRIAVRACTEPEPVTISHPDTAAPALWVVPAGYEGTKKPPTGAVDLVVSTKEAWGDGYHPTTALGLEFLVKHVGLSTQQLLDYGTGSGVLGIALHYGKPVIASNVGSFADLVREARTGYLVEPGDVDALKDCIRELTRESLQAMTPEVEELAASLTWESFARSAIRSPIVEAAEGHDP